MGIGFRQKVGNLELLIYKKEGGVWEITQDNLQPDLYTYSFIVDGVKVDDPNNVYLVEILPM